MWLRPLYTIRVVSHVDIVSGWSGLSIMSLESWDYWVIVCGMIALVMVIKYVGKRMTDHFDGSPPADEDGD